MPGRMPQKKPTRMERKTANLCIQSSRNDGKVKLTFGALYLPLAVFSACTKISDTAKKPRIAGTKAIPAARSVRPKLYLLIPPTGSCPMVAINSPIRTDIHPFQIVRAPTDEATAKPKKTNAKISGGPMFRMAHCARGSVAAIIISAEAIPPIAEHRTAAPTALPDWPFLVIG